MKRFNQFLNVVIGVSVGVLIGHSITVYSDYRKFADLYSETSAPWYSSILLYAGISAAVIVICIAVKYFIKKK